MELVAGVSFGNVDAADEAVEEGDDFGVVAGEGVAPALDETAGLDVATGLGEGAGLAGRLVFSEAVGASVGVTVAAAGLADAASKAMDAAGFGVDFAGESP